MAASSPSLVERPLRFVAWALLALAMSPSPTPADQDSVLLVPGVEYTTPIHFGVAGIPHSLDSFAYQSGTVPPYAAVAADLRSVVWDGRDGRGLPVSSGMYVLRLSTGGRTWTSRLMVNR